MTIAQLPNTERSAPQAPPANPSAGEGYMSIAYTDEDGDLQYIQIRSTCVNDKIKARAPVFNRYLLGYMQEIGCEVVHCQFTYEHSEVLSGARPRPPLRVV